MHYPLLSEAHAVSSLHAVSTPEAHHHFGYFQVNNAGAFPQGWTREAYDECLAVNYRCPLKLTQALLPDMAQDGVVVMVSSWYGQRWV